MIEIAGFLCYNYIINEFNCKDWRYKMMKFSAAILVLAMLASLSACGDNASVTETTDAQTTPTSTETELSPNLPQIDGGGETLTMYMREAWVYDMFADEQSGDTMNDAIYKRNSAVEEQFNVEFAVHTTSGDKYGTGASNAILAGDDSFDIVIPFARYVSVYAHENLLLDWNRDLPNVDLDAVWWNQDARSQFTFNDKLFTAIGDISYDNIGQTMCMMFNKALFDEYSMEYPYQTVTEGKWTLDRMYEYAAKVVMDLNGDSVIDAENDRFGYATTSWSGATQAVYAGGQRVCTKDENGDMQLTLNTPQTVDVFEKFFSIVDSEGMGVVASGTVKAEMFEAGRLLFMDNWLYTTIDLRDMEDDFGIIPWPKYDETLDAYYATVQASCNMITVPVTVKNTELVSAVIEQLAYLGWRDVVPTYYDVVLKSKYARDEESPMMIDLIRAGRVFDIGYFYTASAKIMNQIHSPGHNLTQLADHNFASFYAKLEAQALEQIAAINQFYRDGTKVEE
ncbi:MAG: extracellular solute-binding protein [Ruminococcaceae bacterium]|nr:extracellular solute-binding protein [Oscillospiraceae bacterium]